MSPGMVANDRIAESQISIVHGVRARNGGMGSRTAELNGLDPVDDLAHDAKSLVGRLQGIMRLLLTQAPEHKIDDAEKGECGQSYGGDPADGEHESGDACHQRGESEHRPGQVAEEMPKANHVIACVCVVREARQYSDFC